MRDLRKGSYIKNRHQFYRPQHRSNPFFPQKTLGSTFQRKIIVTLITIFFLWIGGIFLFSEKFSISEVSVSAENYTTREQIKELVESIIKDRKWGRVRSKHIAFFPSQRLKKLIAESFFIESVNVNKKYLHTLTIEVNEKVSQLSIVVMGERYLLDHNGTIVREVPQIYEVTDNEGVDEGTGEVNQVSQNINSGILIYDQGRSETFVGENIFSKSQVESIIKIFMVFESITHVQVDFFTIPERKLGDFILTTQEGWQVFFDIHADVSKQLENFELTFKEKFQNHRENLTYIDLRFGTSVYYKEKE